MRAGSVVFHRGGHSCLRLGCRELLPVPCWPRASAAAVATPPGWSCGVNCVRARPTWPGTARTTCG
eukprot:10233855-Prorocentrum_lima.AAC.1